MASFDRISKQLHDRFRTQTPFARFLSATAQHATFGLPSAIKAADRACTTPIICIDETTKREKRRRSCASPSPEWCPPIEDDIVDLDREILDEQARKAVEQNLKRDLGEKMFRKMQQKTELAASNTGGALAVDASTRPSQSNSTSLPSTIPVDSNDCLVVDQVGLKRSANQQLTSTCEACSDLRDEVDSRKGDLEKNARAVDSLPPNDTCRDTHFPSELQGEAECPNHTCPDTLSSDLQAEVASTQLGMACSGFKSEAAEEPFEVTKDPQAEIASRADSNDNARGNASLTEQEIDAHMVTLGELPLDNVSTDQVGQSTIASVEEKNPESSSDKKALVSVSITPKCPPSLLPFRATKSDCTQPPAEKPTLSKPPSSRAKQTASKGRFHLVQFRREAQRVENAPPPSLGAGSSIEDPVMSVQSQCGAELLEDVIPHLAVEARTQEAQVNSVLCERDRHENLSEPVAEDEQIMRKASISKRCMPKTLDALLDQEPLLNSKEELAVKAKDADVCQTPVSKRRLIEGAEDVPSHLDVEARTQEAQVNSALCKRDRREKLSEPVAEDEQPASNVSTSKRCMPKTLDALLEQEPLLNSKDELKAKDADVCQTPLSKRKLTEGATQHFAHSAAKMHRSSVDRGDHKFVDKYDLRCGHAMKSNIRSCAWLFGSMDMDGATRQRLIAGMSRTIQASSESAIALLLVGLPKCGDKSGDDCANSATSIKSVLTQPPSCVQMTHFMPHEGPVSQIVCSPHKQSMVASRLSHGGALIFDLSRWSCLRDGIAGATSCCPEIRLQAEVTSASVCALRAAGLSWSPRSPAHLVASAGGGVAHLWDCQDKAPLTAFKISMDSDVIGLDFSLAQPETFASCDLAGRVCLWDVRRGGLPAAEVAHAEQAACVSFNKTGELLSTGCSDGCVRIWDPRNLKRCLHSLSWNRGCEEGLEVSKISWAPFDQGILASAHRNGRILLWDLCRREESQASRETEARPAELMFVHEGHAMCSLADVSWSSNVKWLLASSTESCQSTHSPSDGALQFWKPAL